MLLAFLLCVYSEYTSCEHTHQDVVDYVLGRFKFMADQSAGHVWSGKFWFLFAGCRGDLKWLNDSRRTYFLYQTFHAGPSNPKPKPACSCINRIEIGAKHLDPHVKSTQCMEQAKPRGQS